jgi:hypothetical protein
MKIIRINESQQKKLFEAYREGFSLKELSALGNNGWSAQYDYCVKWLGEPDNFGSSRCVFTLSDNIILKLAMGGQYKAGIAQNKQEYEMYETWDSPLLVRIYNVDKNYTFLVSESVVLAKDIDFEKILGIPFYGTSHQKSLKMPAIVGSEPQDYNGKRKSDYTVGYDKYFDGEKKWHEAYYHGDRMESLYNVLCYIEANYVTDKGYYDEVYEDIINSSEWLSQFKDFVMHTGMSDFCQVDNFGMVNRNGKPTLVILDSGLNLDIWDKYYAD